MGPDCDWMGHSRRNCLPMGIVPHHGYKVCTLPTKPGSDLRTSHICNSDCATAGHPTTDLGVACLQVFAFSQRVCFYSKHPCRCPGPIQCQTPQHSTLGEHRECRVQDDWRTQITSRVHQSSSFSRTTGHVLQQPSSAYEGSGEFFCIAFCRTCW